MTSITGQKLELRTSIIEHSEVVVQAASIERLRPIALGLVRRLAARMTLVQLKDWERQLRKQV